MTLVSVALGAGVSLAALLILVSSALSMRTSRQKSREITIATQALGEALETLAFLGATNGFVAYAPNAAGEPYPASGSGSGTLFHATGLVDGKGDTAQVTIEFHPDEIATLPQLGLPRDLDGDGTSAFVNGRIQATLLPVESRLEWQSAGNMTRTLRWFSMVSRDS